MGFVSQCTGYKPNNLWSGLKHLGSLEYDNVPIVAVVDWTTNGRDASECLMFGAYPSKVFGPSPPATCCL